MSVYGVQGAKEQFNELDTINPKSFYAVGKVASELYLRIYQELYGIDYTVLRYFNVYGHKQNMSNLKQGIISIYLKQFIDESFEEVQVKGSLERFRDFSHIDDVIDVTIESINNKNFFNQIINVGTGEKIKVKEILRLLKIYLKSDKKIKLLGGTKGDQFGVFADVTKLKSLYPQKFVSFDQGLEKTIKKICDKEV